MAFRTVGVVLTADATSMKAGLLAASREVQTFDRQVSTAGANVSRQSQLMATAFKATGAAVAVALAYSVKSAVDFETAMRNVNSISHLSEQALKSMSGSVLDLSRQLPQSAETLAKGLYQVASSGFQGADGLKVLTESAKAASAGLTTTDNAATAITAVLNAYGRTADDAADVSDVLFQTVNLGVVSFEELTGVIGDVVGTAAAAGVGIEQVGAAIATMTLSGISADEAGTSLNRTLQSIIQPSEELTTVLHAVGYESGAQALKSDGLRVVMDKLRGAVGGNVEAWLQLFPEIRAARGALALAANEGQNYARVSAEIEDANKRHGATQAALSEQMKATGAQFRVFLNGLNALAIEGGTRLLPFLQDALKGMRELGSDAAPHLAAAFAALQPFFRGVADVGRDLVTIVQGLINALGPLAGALAGLAAGAVIESLNGLAAVLSAITGFLADHTAVVTAAVVAYAGFRIVAGISALLAALPAVLDTIVFGMYGMAGAADTAAASLFTLQGALGAVALVAGALGFTAVITGLNNAKRGADEFYASVVKDFDLTSYQGLSDALDEIGAKQMELEANTKSQGGLFNAFRGAAELLTPMKNSVEDARERVSKLNEEAERLSRVRVNIFENATAVAQRFNITRDAVEELANKLKIDLAQGGEKGAEAQRLVSAAFEDMAKAAFGGGEAIKKASTISIEELQRLKDEMDETVKKTGEAFSRDFDIIAGFGDTAREHATALDGVASASDSVTDATDRLRDAQQGLADLQARQSADTKISIGDQQALRNAHEKVAEAQHGVAEAQLGVAEANRKVTETSPAAFFQNELTAANTFADGIREAAKRGLDPILIQQLLEQGPAQAAPFLQGVLSDHSGRLIGMANDTKAKLDEFKTLSIEFARLTRIAVNSESDTMVRDLGIAMQIAEISMREGGKRSSQAIADELRIGVGEVARISQGFGITLADGLNPVLSGVGAKVIDATRRIASVFAQGGKLDKDSGLASGNTLVQWAEPETQGEYHLFIPRAGDRRKKALGWLGVAADDFGYDLTPRESYAIGGKRGGLNPEFLSRLDRWADATPGGLSITSGFRTRAEQERLYAAYKAGTGNLAAPPGSSMHEKGLAADHSPNSWPLARTADPFGIIHPISSEAWHAQPDWTGGGSTSGATSGAAISHTELPQPPDVSMWGDKVGYTGAQAMQYARDRAQARINAIEAEMAADAAAANAVGAGGGGGGAGGDARAIGQQMAAARGWTGGEWDALNELWRRESGWNPNATNPSSGAYGIPQALPSAHGHPYNLGDARAQIEWGLNYIAGRYGSPSKALAFHNSHNWYAQGGMLSWPTGDPVQGDPSQLGFAEGGYLAQGLAGGLEGATPQVHQAMMQLVDIVKNTMAQALEIRSPSQVFFGYGNDIILGLIDGLRERFPELQRTLDEMLALISAAQPQGPGNISASGGYQWSDSGPLGPGYYTAAELGGSQPQVGLVQPPMSGEITEDNPNWDWRTMGNQQHGIQDRNGNWFIETADGQILPHPRSPGAIPMFQHGGIVPIGAHPGEMVLPRNVSTYLLDTARQYAQGGRSSGGSPIDYDRLERAVTRNTSGFADRVADRIGDRMTAAISKLPAPVTYVDAVNKAQHSARMALK